MGIRDLIEGVRKVGDLLHPPSPVENREGEIEGRRD